MTAIAEKQPRRADRAARREKRRFFAERLAVAGFGPLAVRDRALPAILRIPPADRGPRFRTALAALGPLYVLLARYLGSRPDLLPIADCRVLAAIDDSFAPLAPAAIAESFRRETGRSIDEAFSDFGPLAVESRILFQSHVATRRGGERVTIRFVRPGVADELEAEACWLPLLAEVLEADPPLANAVRRVADDFPASILAQCDLGVAATALDELARDGKKLFGVPRVFREWSGPHVLCVERVEGTSVAELLRGSSGSEAGERSDLSPVAVGRRLVGAWLVQLLSRRIFPVDLRAEQIVVRSDSMFFLTGGVFAALEPAAADDVAEYLTAISIDDPDEACRVLIREMAEPRPDRAFELRHRFRQIVPFRDGGWESAGSAQSMAENMFVQWRFAQDAGFRPRGELVTFFRGLFGVVEMAERLAPEKDALVMGLGDIRSLMGFEEVRELAARRPTRDDLARIVGMVMDLPRRADDILSVAEDAASWIRLQELEGAARRRAAGNAVTTVILFFLTGVAGLTWTQIAPDGGPASARIAVLFFLLLGELLLRAIEKI